MKRKIVTRDVPSKGGVRTGVSGQVTGFTRPFKIPIPESVTRKFLRMTAAERTKFVELFAGFTPLDWRRFRAMIRKLTCGGRLATAASQKKLASKPVGEDRQRRPGK